MIKIIGGILLGIWLLLYLLGKSGFIHIILLVGISVVIIELVAIYRQRLKV